MNTQATIITHEAIAEVAYLLWEKEGRPAGRDQELWLKAENQLKAIKPVAPEAKTLPAVKPSEASKPPQQAPQVAAALAHPRATTPTLQVAKPAAPVGGGKTTTTLPRKRRKV